MARYITRFFSELMGGNKFNLDAFQKREIERYVDDEQKDVEKLVSLTGFLIWLCLFVINVITGLAFRGSDTQSLYYSLLIYSLMPVYFLAVWILQKKGIYSPAVKYVTPVLLASTVTGYLVLYSNYEGWLFTMFCSAITNYFLIFVFMGLYQAPKLSIYTVSIVIMEFLGLLLYAFVTYKSLPYQYLTVSSISNTLLSTFCFYFIMNYVPVFLFCGFIVTVVSRRTYAMLARALFFEKEAAKIEIERKAIDLRSRQKIDSFLTLAHDAKTPLTIIGNYLERVIGSRGEARDREAVARSYGKLKSEIEHLLNAGRFEQPQNGYDHDRVIDLSGLLAESVTMFQELAVVKHIRLESYVEDGLFTKIDPFALDRIVNNLVDNAIKYTRENGTICIRAAADADRIVLTVRDDGIGISEKEKERIFEPYVRSAGTDEFTKGFGLGLFIVKKIVDEVGGSISVESRIDGGTTFTLFFAKSLPGSDAATPECIALPESERARYGTEAETPGGHGRPVVLIVDDNRELLAFLHENLSSRYSIHYALNGEEALEKLERMPLPEVIVSDIVMDVMDGHRFRARLAESEKYANVPFIFLTARTPVNEQIDGLSRGAIDYICKPFHVEVLARKMESILRLKREQHESDIRDMEARISHLIRGKSSADDPRAAIETSFDKYDLTSREKDIANLILAGKENKEIGAVLDISSNTVKQHVQNIYRKCGVQNRVELVNIIKGAS